MAKSKKEEIVLPVASILIKSREEVKRLIEEQIDAADSILNIQVAKVRDSYSYDMFGGSRSRGDKYDEAQQTEFLRQYNIWNSRCKEIFTRSFEHSNNSDLAGYNSYCRSYFISDIVEEQKKSIRDQVAYMKGFIDRLDLIPCKEVTENPVPKTEDTRKVFIVHGHNEAVNQEVARAIEKMGLEAIILREQPNSGQTIIEKFENNAKDVNFAIILLTADDKIDGEEKYRARQNVVFEMGYFMGALGRKNVMCMVQDQVEKPGDIDGVVYTVIDGAGVWKFSIVKELKACGYNVDANTIM